MHGVMWVAYLGSELQEHGIPGEQFWLQNEWSHELTSVPDCRRMVLAFFPRFKKKSPLTLDHISHWSCNIVKVFPNLLKILS